MAEKALGGEKYDLDIHYDFMRQKAMILSQMPDQLRPLMDGLDRRTRKYVIDKLGGFSHGADKALTLDSVFYMSALLYPENYCDGGINDLDDFINCLERDAFYFSRHHS